MGNPLDEFIAQLNLSEQQIKTIAEDFRQAMADGLSGNDGPLKMLPSFLAPPMGEERGKYLAVDFGGTNIRVMEVDLSGGEARIRQYKTQKLPAAANGDELFAFIARMIKDLKIAEDCALGHTFSFPCRQDGVNRAVLLTWTKEIDTPGVVGHDINQLLEEALRRENLCFIHPVAILNDTVGTLLTGAYYQPQTDIAAICGTGHNTCYVEARSPLTGKAMIINMESGNFDRLPYTRYDEWLDRESEQPGRQRLEKMTAGRYLGELTRLALRDLGERHRLLSPGITQVLGERKAVTSEEASAWLTQEGCACWLAKWAKCDWNRNDCRIFTETSRAIFRRSAKLVAATFLGVLRHMDPDMEKCHHIAVDGSLYEKIPGYAAEIDSVLSFALADKAHQVKAALVKDGSGIGAAVAAAIAAKRGMPWE